MDAESKLDLFLHTWREIDLCYSGKTQNFVGVHPTRKEDLEDLKTGKSSDRITQCTELSPYADMKTLMLAEFSHFDPNIVDIIA
jgi:hypothetical protein